MAKSPPNSHSRHLLDWFVVFSGRIVAFEVGIGVFKGEIVMFVVYIVSFIHLLLIPDSDKLVFFH